MALEIEQHVGMLFDKGRLFLNRDDLVKALMVSSKSLSDGGQDQAAMTVEDIADGLKEITIGKG